MSERPYLDYYISNKIIPVRQDISQLESHLKRRSVLYHHLSIPPAAVRSQRVLEIGPGTGDNAIHTASLSPKAYVLVDGNPYSIAATRIVPELAAGAEETKAHDSSTNSLVRRYRRPPRYYDNERHIRFSRSV